MPDRSDPFRIANQAQADLRAQARRLGLAGVATALERGEPLRPSLQHAPVVIDTDIGGDPDDAMALVIAARHLPQLALVVTSDERGGQRARFARQLLDACGRSEVPVIAGRSLAEGESHLCVADLLDRQLPDQPTELVATVQVLAAAIEGPIRWVGLGPATNLASLIEASPDLAARLRLTQMGGALHYRDEHRGEHNVRRDVPAARKALAAVTMPWLVTSDVTFTDQLQVTSRTPIYQRWADPEAPSWARLLRANLDRWIAGSGHQGSMAHDPLTLAVAIGLPFVEVDLDRVVFDEVGRMRLDPAGSEVFYSHSADYPAIWRWLVRQLDPTSQTGSGDAPPGAGD